MTSSAGGARTGTALAAGGPLVFSVQHPIITSSGQLVYTNVLRGHAHRDLTRAIAMRLP
jgi:hypothetical protein